MSELNTALLCVPSGLWRRIALSADAGDVLLRSGEAELVELAPAVDFAVTVDGQRLTSHDFEPRGHALTPDALHLTRDWEYPTRGLRVRTSHRVDPELHVIRKWLTIAGRGELTAIELESWTLRDARGPTGPRDHHQVGMGPMGIGQPLFWHGFFLGIEHPGAENWVTPTGLVCRFPCLQALTDKPFASPSCVLGAGLPGDEWPAFMDYIDRLRPHRTPPFVTLINNWYQFGRLRHRDRADIPGTTALAEMRAFAKLAADINLPLDSYCLDDPWTDPPPPEFDGGPSAPRTGESPPAPDRAGLWDAIGEALFPGGLASLKAAAAPLGLGLWVGPIGGYLGRGPLVALGQSLGYETFHDTADTSGFCQTKLCCHGPRYHAHLRESLTHWARQGVRYWKFDGIEFHCDAPSHGHPVGPQARTAQMDSWIDLMTAIRAEEPESVIAFTTGSNPSPWWLPHVDFIWRGGYDDRTIATDAPRRERFASYIDACLHAARDTAMPVAAIVVFGLIQNAALTYASEQETPDDFERALWLMVGRGSHHHDLYVSPDTLSPDAWARLARVLHWARAHRSLLARMRMVLGDPGRGEIYGFASWRDGRGLVTLRNPSGQAATLNASLSELFPHAGLPARARVAITPAYGPAPAALLDADAPLALPLPPYGVALFMLARAPAP